MREGQAEVRLILLLARVRLEGAAKDVLHRLLQGSLDWEVIGSYAGYHDILPLVSRHLTEQGRDEVPPDVLGQLHRQARGFALEGLRQALELADLVRAFEGAGIPVIPLKGPALADAAYGDIAYRRSIDLDLFVRRDHLEQAIRLLETQGYQPRHGDTSTEERRARIESQIGYDLVHIGKGIAVELHWNFFSVVHGYRFDLEAIWQRQRWIPFAGTEIRALAPEDMLIYLCIHGMKHRWLKLKWVCDVAEYVRAHPDMNWEEVQQRTDDLGVQRIVRLGLLLARDLVDAALPHAVVRWMEHDRTAQRLARMVRRSWILQPLDAWRATPGTLFWFHLRERERWRDRLPYAMHNLRLILAPSQKDRAFLQLPKGLEMLYVLVRPFRVVWERVHATADRQSVDPPTSSADPHAVQARQS